MKTHLRAVVLPTLITLLLLLLLLGGSALGQSFRHGSAKRNANLRSGPGTTFAIVGSVKAGQPLTFTTAITDWYQLDTGPWIAAFLVNLQTTPPPAKTPTPAQPPVPTATPVPPPTPTQPPAANCDPSYPSVCIPPAPPDLDCGDVPYINFSVVGSDPHRFDRDHDGIGCEK